MSERKRPKAIVAALMRDALAPSLDPTNSARDARDAWNDNAARAVAKHTKDNPRTVIVGVTKKRPA